MKTTATLVHDAILYSFDETSAYAFDVKSEEKWRLRGKFRNIVDDDNHRNRFYAFTADGLAYCLELHP